MSVTFKAILLACLVLGLDQLSKFYVLDILQYQSIMRLNDFCNLLLVWNKGVTFGIFSDVKRITVILEVVTILITIGLFYWLIRSKNKTEQYALGMIIGGASGNIIDRLRFGAVIDFIDLHVGAYHWYVFNIADSAICLAVFLMLVLPYLNKEKKE
jgi:signal peptidase II